METTIVNTQIFITQKVAKILSILGCNKELDLQFNCKSIEYNKNYFAYGEVCQSNTTYQIKVTYSFVFANEQAELVINYIKISFVNSNNEVFCVLENSRITAVLPNNKKQKFCVECKNFEYPKLAEFVTNPNSLQRFKGPNGLFGFINKYTKTIVIKPLYKDAHGFSNGLSAVQKDDKYGYINSKGESIIPFEYEKAMPFYESITAVKRNNKWGYINQRNQEIVPIIYDWVGDYCNKSIETKLNNCHSLLAITW